MKGHIQGLKGHRRCGIDQPKGRHLLGEINFLRGPQNYSILVQWLAIATDNGHSERAFFQKFETFGLGQTNWAEILGGILAISSQTIGTILAL